MRLKTKANKVNVWAPSLKERAGVLALAGFHTSPESIQEAWWFRPLHGISKVSEGKVSADGPFWTW